MLPLSRLPVLLTLTVVCVIAIPMAFAASDLAAWDGSTVPIVLAAEFVVYFILGLLANKRMKLQSLAGVAIVMMVARAAATALGLGLYMLAIAPQPSQPPSFVAIWAGVPLAAFLQGLVLVLGWPHAIAFIAPSLLGSDAMEKMAPDAIVTAPREVMSHDTAPAGGFIQAYDFDEVAALVRKSPSVEGMLITSNEGLVVWRDLPLRLDVDEVAAQLEAAQASTGDLFDRYAIGAPRMTLYQTPMHTICHSALDGNFGLILFYRAEASTQEIQARFGVLARTVQEFLHWKYPGLPAGAPLLRETRY